MAHVGKRTKAAREGIDPMKLYSLDEAVKLVKARAKAKFDETVEVAMNLGVDPRHADQMVRGVVPAAERHRPDGPRRRCSPAAPRPTRRKAAGADIVGAEDLVEQVQGGKIDFDRCIATPDMMPLVGRLGKVLGPRGLMPNPKVGTVTQDVAGAVKDAKGGAVEFRVEKAGIVQAGVGKASFGEQQLVENIKAFADAVQKAKPAGAKGTYRPAHRGLLDHGPGRQGRSGHPRRSRAVQSARPAVRAGHSGATWHQNCPARRFFRNWAWQVAAKCLNTAMGAPALVRCAFMRLSKSR